MEELRRGPRPAQSPVALEGGLGAGLVGLGPGIGPLGLRQHRGGPLRVPGLEESRVLGGHGGEVVAGRALGREEAEGELVVLRHLAARVAVVAAPVEDRPVGPLGVGEELQAPRGLGQDVGRAVAALGQVQIAVVERLGEQLEGSEGLGRGGEMAGEHVEVSRVVVAAIVAADRLAGPLGELAAHQMPRE